MRNKHYMIYVTIFLILIISIVKYEIPSQAVNRKQLSNSKSTFNISKEEISKLKYKMEISQNNDKGFGFIADYLRTCPKDLYSTYYSLEILKLTDTPQYKDIKVQLNKDSISFNNLDEIYYSCKLFSEAIKQDKELLKKIEQFVISKYNSEGYFMDESMSHDLFINYTYMCTEILNNLNIQYDKGPLLKWAEKQISSLTIKNKDITYSEFGNLVFILKMYKHNNWPLEKHIGKMVVIQKNIEKTLDTSLANDDIYMFYLDAYSDFLNLTKRTPNKEIVNKLVSYIINNLNSDCGFALTNKAKPDILSTYIAVKFLNNFDPKKIEKNKIEQLILKYRMTDGYFIGLGEIPSNINDTYYAYKILDLIKVDIDSYEFKTFLEEYKDTGLYHPYILEMLGKLDNDNYNKYKSSIEKEYKNFLNQLINEETVDLKDKMNIYRCLSILKMYNISIEDFKKLISDKILNEKNTSQKAEEKLIIDCVNFKILAALNYDSAYMKKMELKLSKELSVLDNISANKLKILYLYFSSLKEGDIHISEEKKGFLERELSKCYLEEGLFLSGDSNIDISNYETTYYGLWLYSKCLGRDI